MPHTFRLTAADPQACARDVDFAMASRDELWHRGKCVDRIRGHGTAVQRGTRIEATDARDDALMRLCTDDIVALRDVAQTIADGYVRAIATARRIDDVIVRESTITITIRHVSIVTTATLASRDAEFLRELVATEAKMSYEKLPILWRNGSAAVLLHEAVGHAAEHRAAPVGWPQWLIVSDEPPMLIDDCGNVPHAADLLREPPSCVRRESFRDVPLRRMTALVVRQKGAPLDIPDERIEVQLVAGGGYDALTDTVLINVAVADLVRGRKRQRLRPFKIRDIRSSIAESLCGAEGEPLRYPGVICSREGQEIAVGSFAPVMMTS